MMLNRDRDRERAPLSFFVGSSKKKALIGMVQILMFFLVSFGFEPSPPRLWLVFWKPSSWIFFSYAASPFYINYLKDFLGSLENRMKSPGENTKRERKSRKGGKKSSASSYWNFFI